MNPRRARARAALERKLPLEKETPLNASIIRRHFREIDCGGEGDCFFLMATHGTRALQAKPKVMAPKDLLPGGQLQENLRMLVSATIAGKKKYPKDEAEKAAKTGE